MKKLILFILSVFILSSLAGCSLGSSFLEKCDICNDFGAHNKVKAITTWNLCDDCYDNYRNKYDSKDYDSDDYDFDLDDYDSDSDDSDNYYGLGNRCSDCGAGIPSGRLYCDECLGYGTCQDCGKNIDSDRLYCDRCLGYGTCQDCGRSIDSDRLYCDRCLGYGTCQDCGKSIDSDRLYCDSCLWD